MVVLVHASEYCYLDGFVEREHILEFHEALDGSVADRELDVGFLDGFAEVLDERYHLGVSTGDGELNRGIIVDVYDGEAVQRGCVQLEAARIFDVGARSVGVASGDDAEIGMSFDSADGGGEFEIAVGDGGVEDYQNLWS